MINNWYFLDRNILNRIKEQNNGKIDENDNKKQEIIKKLKEIDKKGNIISIAFSILEGSKRGEGTEISRQEDIIKESEQIDIFFKNARTDSKILLRYKEEASQALSMEKMIASYDIRKKFLEAVHPILDIKEGQNPDKALEEIISIIKKTEINPSDPIIEICVSCIYGSQTSQLLLKPKREFSAHNFLSDFYAIQNIEYFKHLYRQISNYKKTKFEFITMDRGLENLKKLIEITVEKTNSHIYEEVTFNSIVYSNIYPTRITNRKIEEIKEKIRRK